MKDLFFLNKIIKDFLNKIIKPKHLEFYIAIYISMNIVSLSEPLQTMILNPSFFRISQKSQNLWIKVCSHMVSMNVFSYTTSSS